MRLRTKTLSNGSIECIIVAADNDGERERLGKIYDFILKHMSEEYGKPILKAGNEKTSKRIVPSEQLPKAICKRAEGRRKSRETKKRNKASKRAAGTE